MTATELELLSELEDELEEEAMELQPLFFRPLITARERHEGALREAPARQLQSRVAANRPTPAVSCANYVRGEVQKSRTARGHLPLDVIAHPRGLLIANFGVDWRT